MRISDSSSDVVSSELCALEEKAPDEITLGDNRVQRSVDMGERVIGWDQHRVDTLEQPILTRFGHAHQADSETQRCSFCAVGRYDMADACNVHLIECNRRDEGETGPHR